MELVGSVLDLLSFLELRSSSELIGLMLLKFHLLSELGSSSLCIGSSLRLSFEVSSHQLGLLDLFIDLLINLLFLSSEGILGNFNIVLSCLELLLLGDELVEILLLLLLLEGPLFLREVAA